MGIDPVTHKPKTNALGSDVGQSKDAANLSHMAQWESARLEAEARLVRESKQLVSNNPPQDQLSGSTSAHLPNKLATAPPPARPQCLDVLKAWQGVVFGMFGVARDNLESPTSTLKFQDNMLSIPPAVGFGGNNFVGNCFEKPNQMQGLKENLDDSAAMHEMADGGGGGATWFQDSFRAAENIMEGLSDILICDSGEQNSSLVADNSNGITYSGNFEDDKNYWNSMINLVNASTTWSPVF